MEIAPEAVYAIRLTRREYSIMCRSLGLASGLDVKFKPEERGEAAALNKSMLEQQAAHLRQWLSQTEGKLAQATTVEREP